MLRCISDFVISNIKGVKYCCVINGNNKSEAKKLMKNINLNVKNRNII